MYDYYDLIKCVIIIWVVKLFSESSVELLPA